MILMILWALAGIGLLVAWTLVTYQLFTRRLKWAHTAAMVGLLLALTVTPASATAWLNHQSDQRFERQVQQVNTVIDRFAGAYNGRAQTIRSISKVPDTWLIIYEDTAGAERGALLVSQQWIDITVSRQE